MDAAIAHERLLASVRNNPDTGCRDRAGRVSNRGCGNRLCIEPERLELIDPAGERLSPHPL